MAVISARSIPIAACRAPASITLSLRHNSATPTKPADNVNDASRNWA
jgi:hypothetical protein